MSKADDISQGLVIPPAGCCFHCGELLPKRPFYAEILGASRPMCCMGCQLAGQSIAEAGLEQYYLDRQVISRIAPMPEALNFAIYNHSDIKKQFTYVEDGLMVAELSVVGLRCAACSWLVESRLYKINGIASCQVNLTQQRMRVLWDEDKVAIGDILQTVNDIGYEARPYRQDTHEARLKRQNKMMLMRLGVAAVGTMQAMMFSVGLYFGAYSGMAEEHRQFLRLVAMLVSIPVVFFAGLPFFVNAWTAMRAKQVNMDIPVAIALLLTFSASSFAVLSGTGETYFDSVAMFVFFLLAGRYVESNARLRAGALAGDLLTVKPKLVARLGNDAMLLKQIQAWQALDASARLAAKQQLMDSIAAKLAKLPAQGVPTHDVAVGDIVQVGAGDEVLGDGILLSPTAGVSQSLLTGESDLLAKNCGDTLLGGSQNDTQPLLMLITKDQQNSEIALIDRLMSRAVSEKPKIAVEADRMARWFVGRVLVLALVVFGLWWWVDKTQALWATVAVLVATCPCALSLATPIALTVATNRLAYYQVLATRGHTIATLAKVSHVAFDKTGTLTTGTPTLLGIALEAAAFDGFNTDEQTHKNNVLALAAALEAGSHHPIAQSLQAAARGLHLPKLSHIAHQVGGGVMGEFRGAVYRLGHQAFSRANSAPDLAGFGANMAVVLTRQLSDESAVQALAWFYFNDVVRLDSKKMLDALKMYGMVPLMLTGDPSAEASALGQQLGIDSYTGLLPGDKVAYIRRLQQGGATVLMVGDGVNDAPVLAAADVSLAMASGADLAQVASDGVLLADTLMPLVSAIAVAKKTASVIRQNLRWALVYNTLVIIPAALGYVPPWLAAIGMSLSSLLVVGNALRIKYS